MKSVSLETIRKTIGLKLITGSEKTLRDRSVSMMGVNRGGLELAGFISTQYANKVLRRIIILGSKESEYIKTLDKEIAVQRFEGIFENHYPTIVLSRNFDVPS